MHATLSEQSIVVASKDQVWCDLGGEAAILQMKSGVYYGLDPVGARIWGLIQQPRSVAEVCETLEGEYDVEHERCQRDLITLLESLMEQGLIELNDAPTG